MAFDITDNARNAADQTNVKPVISMEIDGLGAIFATTALVTYIRIGDPGLYINNYNGTPWVIGGFRKLENQFDYISFDSGGAAKMTQSLRSDQGQGTSVSRLNLALIDKNEEISELISPGFVLDEILGRNVIVKQGFEGTSYPDDYITIFRGTIEGIDSGPGLINFGLSNVEEKKRQGIYRKKTTDLAVAITDVSTPTTVTVDSTDGYLVAVNGPTGVPDPAVSFYFKINDEIFSYTGKTATTFTGVTRAQLGSVAEAHDLDDSVDSVVRFQDNGVQLALKIMLSGLNDFYIEDEDIKSFNFINIDLTVPNSIYINDIDFINRTGVTVGDYVTITDAINGGNNQAAVQIIDVVQTDSGCYLTLDGTFVVETGSTAKLAIRSQYDSYPEGLGMKPFEVDVKEHQTLFRLFLSSFDYDFKVEDISNAKQFLDEQVYLPMSGYSIPRKGQVSMGYNIGPIPGSNIVTLNADNVTNANTLKLRRSLTQNFTNTVRYNTDFNIVTGDFDRVYSYEDIDSKALIQVGDKTFEINAEGMTAATQAETRAAQAASRRLKRYSKGAEFIGGVDVLYGTGFTLEISDIVLVDRGSLKITDTSTGNRSGDLVFMEISNKTLDNKGGKVTLDLLATSIAVGERYGLISPASYIKSAASASILTVEKSFFTNLVNEGRKWSDLIGASIKVRSEDYTTVSTTSIITAVSGDQITLSIPLNFVPTAGQIMELSDYDDQPDLIKSLYAFYSDGTNDFVDGEQPYVFL